jgi:hypothetical protein
MFEKLFSDEQEARFRKMLEDMAKWDFVRLETAAPTAAIEKCKAA